MLVFGKQRETLPVKIHHDVTSGLPLLSEQDAIMQIILAYLALPYSVAEYGCGKKCSLIIDQLLALDVPAYAISRGMILERDMSPEAMAQTDGTKREHALIAHNPLYDLCDISDERLQEMLRETGAGTQVIDNRFIKAGTYLLSHAEQVQFVTARSHIYPIVTFWDADQGREVDRVIDPSLHRSDWFAVEQVREYLNAPEGLLFEAPLLAHFRLDSERLTPAQRQAVETLLGHDSEIDDLSHEAHADLVQRLTGARSGSIGDPMSWTYANNIKGSEHSDEVRDDDTHILQQAHDTGRGDAYVTLRRDLRRAREQQAGDISEILAQLRNVEEHSDVRRIAKADARWSAEQLEPLADAAMVIVYFNSLSALAQGIGSGDDILEYLDNTEQLQTMRGLGVRLRRRIDWLSRVSREPDGRIDARALRPGFVEATVELIRQMNRAGLAVFLDRVGNVHGLLVDPSSHKALQNGDKSPAEFTFNSIGHGSHIDTVNDAGKFDGRLGVLSGVETAHILRDLERYFERQAIRKGGPITHVSAFIGEEMTFTGEGVSMPGSAAVCARATPERVHNMRNGDGDRYGDCLQQMLLAIKARQAAGEIALCNNLAQVADDELLAACSDPTEFYTPHSFERHIEQGPILDRADVPIVMVGTIMGIYQEDFFFAGERAEAAALAMNCRMRDLTKEARFSDVRITVGILEGRGEAQTLEQVDPALRWTLEGEMNHAGATPTPDRSDPGVAAGRLAQVFADWFESGLDDKQKSEITPVVCNARVLPGTNRNVIPGTASVTLALLQRNRGSGAIDEDIQEDMLQSLEAYAVGTLARRVAGGGEAVRLCRVDPISYVNVYPEARLSIDLRSDDQATTDAFRECIDEIISDIQRGYGVRISSELQQKLQPSPLEETGQALLMERSYGGSHNPRETELLSDIVRGSLLQVAVTREILGLKTLEGLNLFQRVERRIPRPWLDKMARFTSGALHDTCNIAARARQREAPVAARPGLTTV